MENSFYVQKCTSNNIVVLRTQSRSFRAVKKKSADFTKKKNCILDDIKKQYIL